MYFLSNHKTWLWAWWKPNGKRRYTVEIQNILRSGCRCDDTDNVAPSDKSLETSNRSIEFNDAIIMIMLCVEMRQRLREEKNLGGQCPRILSVATGPNVLQGLIIFKV